MQLRPTNTHLHFQGNKAPTRPKLYKMGELGAISFHIGEQKHHPW